MEKVILKNDWGGLGDSLMFSTLPEEFYKQKGIPFYLSDRCAPCRNAEIFDLVWKNNPYFKGYSNEEPNAGIVNGIVENFLGAKDVVYNWEICHGLTPTNHYPKIYIDIPKINETECLIDLTSYSAISSYLPHKEKVLDKVMELINLYNVKEYCVVEYNDDIKLENKKIASLIDVPGAKKIKINNLIENAGTIASTKHYISLISGGAILAATLRDQNEKNIDVIILKEEHKLPHHRGEWGWYFGNQTHHQV